MKNILIPTDFSENAWNALIYGLTYFNKTPCTFYILHVNPIPPYSGAGSAVRAAAENFKDIVLKESRESLGNLMKKIEKLPLNTKHTFVTNAVYDYLIDAVKREAEEKKIDLIIMGTKGASGLKKATIGSNTGDVITKVKCPLLAVPENAEYRQPKEIAFPTDYETGYDAPVLDSLKELLLFNKACLRSLYVNKKGKELTRSQQQNKKLLSQYLNDIEHSSHTLTHVDLETAVQCFIQSRDIDMITMVAKNLNFIQRIMFRPMVEKISYHTDIPFLVLHE